MSKVRLTKAYGLKSSLAVNDELVFTSFGKGNESILESKLNLEKNVVNLNEPPKFKVEYDQNDQSLNLSHNIKKVPINNPLNNSEIGMDYLELKNVIEKNMFGQTFNDNIHIQIAYNVLDIPKMLSLYFYNIIYSFNNLQRKPLYSMDNDLIGTLRPEFRFEEINPKQQNLFNTFKENITPYFDFYGSVFRNDKNNPEKCDKHNYNVLRLLALCRNFLAYTKSDLFTINSKLSSMPELNSLLDLIFEKDFKNINKGFNENAKKNLFAVLNILKIDLYDKQKVNEVFEEYYNFAIFKESKNIGINIKKVREAIYSLNLFKENVSDHSHDTYRPKINTVMDFILYKYIHIDNPSIELDFVNELRATLTEEQKDECYLEYAKEIFHNLTNDYYNVVNLCYIVRKAAIMKVRDIRLDFAKQIERVSKIDRISTFTKFIYFISKFLEPKEINELYSSMINKFDNISGLIDVGNKVLETSIKFSDEYGIFNDNVGKLASELRICRSISKMKPEMNHMGKQLYIDALSILGLKDEVFEDQKLLDETLDEFLEREKGDKQLRNFIVNNVIKSKNFITVVKYMNPKQCVQFVKSDVVLDFVLKEIKDEQIDRYYKACYGDVNCDINQKRTAIKKALRTISFEHIKEKEQLIVDASKKRNNKPVEFERLKSIVGLYLTFVYRVVKHLVKINSVHIIAMQCYERDAELLNMKNPLNEKEHLIGEKSLELLNRMIELKKYNKHTLKYLNDNLSYYNQLPRNDIFKSYRDKVMHLNFISNAYKYLDLRKMESYYDLYQYIIQRSLFEFINKTNPLWEQYKNDVFEYDFYSKNMTKIINLPFAYNLARYKNLTIGDLYNDNYKKGGKN